MKKVGRQFSHSTMRAMGIGDDDEEFEGLRDHWLEKQISVYSKYKSFFFGGMKTDVLPDEQHQYGFEFDFLASAINTGDNDAEPDKSKLESTGGLGSDSVFLDGSIRRFNSTAGSKSGPYAGGLASSAAAARSRLASNASTLSNVPIQRLPSVSEIGKDLVGRVFKKQATTLNDLIDNYVLSSEQLSSNCRENNVVIGAGQYMHLDTPNDGNYLNHSAGYRATGFHTNGTTPTTPGPLSPYFNVPSKSRPIFLPTFVENSVSDEEPSEEEEEEEEDEQEEDDVENDEDTFVSANDEGFSFDPQDSLKVPPVQTSKQNSTEGSSGQKLSAAGSRISARRAQMLQRNLPAAGSRLHQRKKLSDGSKREERNGSTGITASRRQKQNETKKKLKMFNSRMRRLDSHVRDQIAGISHYRPYFSWWITIVHVLVVAISLIQHGFGPFGFDMENVEDHVLRKTLDAQQVSLLEPRNIWIGPRPMELIKMGAKYTPCIATLPEVQSAISSAIENEKETGCCVFMSAARRTGHNFCFQSSESNCIHRIATLDFFKHKDAAGPVCGLDPKYCESPSPFNHPWPENITDWPICKKALPSSDYHMTCEITGRPCCFGPLGQCIVTSEEYCAFVRGMYHPEAFLCSQVSCLSEICGLLPNIKHEESPNQFYRLFLSLLIHAGLIQLLFTVVLQMTLLRFMEILAGPWRTAAVYVLSGMSGNLLSAILLPYQAQVGPYPCLFGILGSYIVELFHLRHYLLRPWKAWTVMGCVCVVLFMFGLLPWLDNFMHFFGLFNGALLSLVFLPYIHLRKRDRFWKLFVSVLAFGSYLFMNIFLIVILFSSMTVSWPKWAQYLTCLPFTSEFCSQLKTELITG